MKIIQTTNNHKIIMMKTTNPYVASNSPTDWSGEKRNTEILRSRGEEIVNLCHRYEYQLCYQNIHWKKKKKKKT